MIAAGVKPSGTPVAGERETGGVSASELLEAGAAAVYEGPADLLAHIDNSSLSSPGE
jgi:hypothetical protein